MVFLKNKIDFLDAEITPTSQDATDISEGKVPTSLLYDGLHPNDACHRVLGTRLFQIMKSLGYLTK